MAAAIFREELTVYPASAITEITEEEKGIRIRFTNGDDEHDIRYESVLAAVGRVPALKGLDLQNTGLRLDTRGIPVFDPQTMRCGDSNIFLAGDADGFRQLLHEAADEGDIAGKNAALFPQIMAQPRQVPLGIVFTDPQMATVGKSFAELRPAAFVTGAADFSHQPRARIMGKNRGLIHVYVEQATGLLLGAELICPAAEHLAHLLALAIRRQLTVAEMLEMPFYHPTLEEGFKNALQSAAKQLKR
jgi:dihydrolipoamide dehydrogenase